MKKVLAIEVQYNNPILLMAEKNIRIIIREPMKFDDMIGLTQYYIKRGFISLDCSPLKELDFSGLMGINKSHFDSFKTLLKD
jgi:hypothetical protein